VEPQVSKGRRPRAPKLVVELASAGPERPARREKELGELRRRQLADAQNGRCARECLLRSWEAESDPLLRGQIHNELARCEQEHEEIASLDAKSRAERENLRSEIADCEAHFAQSEILKHLQTNRRRFTPLNVSRAMAGIPLVTARVSSELCTRHRMTQSDGILFEVFRMLERALKEPCPNLGDTIDSLRNQLVSGPGRNLPHAAELRKNWYFVATAIRSAMGNTDGPFGSLPFRVFAEYCKKTSSPTMPEALRAEAESLENPAPRF
jgi:hypothetical protein